MTVLSDSPKLLMERYDVLKRRVVSRQEPFLRFMQFLEGETTWLTSPASTRYHLAVERGLLAHSVGVADTLLQFSRFLAPAIPEESCVITGLLHDVGKLGMAGRPLYIPNDNEWQLRNQGIRYRINQEVTAMGLAVRSLYLVAQYIPLSDEEAQAIAYHDGQYVEENRVVAHKESPLTLLLHWADYWTAHIYEEGREHLILEREES